MTKHLILFAALFTSAHCCSVSLPAQEAYLRSENEELARQLRQRRLFKLAQAHCRNELKNQNLSPRDKAFLTAELIRAYVDQAYQAKPDQRATNWELAIQAANDFLKQNKDHPFQRLIEVQNAMTSLAGGILLRQEIESGGANSNSPAFETAFNHLRLAVRSLEELNEQLGDDILQAKEDVLFDQGLNKTQTIALQNHVRFQLAQGYMNRAMLYADAENENRLDALQRVREIHTELLRQIDNGQPLWWDVQLDRLKSARLLQDYNAFDEVISEVTTADFAKRLTPAFTVGMRTQQIRAAVQRKQIETARKLFDEFKENPVGVATPEFRLAEIELKLAFANNEPEKEKSSAWQKQCIEIVKQLEQTHGSYWSRRGNQLLIKSAGSNPESVDLQVLVRVAESNYLKGEFDNAIKSYDAAATKASQINDAKQQFDFLYKSALIEHQRKNYPQAISRLRSLSKKLPSDSRAAHAHLIAVVDSAELVKKDSKLLSDYVDSMQEQIKLWPDDPATDQARIWYSGILAYQRQSLESIKTLLDIKIGSPSFVSAIRTAVKRTLAILDRGDVDSASRNQFIKSYAAIFNEAFAEDSGEISNNRWWAMALSATVLYQLNITIENQQLQQLQKLVDESQSAPEELLIASNKLLALEYATGTIQADPFVQSATAVIKQSPEAGLTVVQQVLQHGNLDASIARKLPALVKLLSVQKANLSKQSQSILLTLDAKTAAASGDDQRAIKLFDDLIKSQPRDLAVRIEFAKLLSRSKQEVQQKRALEQWRIIANATKPRSSEWFEAKYNVARNLQQLGETKKARDFLIYLKEIPPGWKNSVLKDQFEKLLGELTN